MPDHEVWIYCDDPSHAARRAHVETFVYERSFYAKASPATRRSLEREDPGSHPEGFWMPSENSGLRKNRRPRSQRMLGNAPVPHYRASGLSGVMGDVRVLGPGGEWTKVEIEEGRTLAELDGDREKWPLTCRKCGPTRRVQVRKEKLDHLLDLLRIADETSLSLAHLAAMLQEQSKSTSPGSEKD